MDELPISRPDRTSSRGGNATVPLTIDDVSNWSCCCVEPGTETAPEACTQTEEIGNFEAENIEESGRFKAKLSGLLTVMGWPGVDTRALENATLRPENLPFRSETARFFPLAALRSA